MGDRGPAPRRDDERRRRNEPAHPITKLSRSELQELPFEVDVEPAPPEVGEDWHPLVWGLWEALKTDPSRKWMTSADWAATALFFESMSRELGEQVINVTKEGEVIRELVPVKGASLGNFLRLLDHIGVTEAARLRLQKEITLFPTTPIDTEGNVVDIARARQEDVQ